MLPQWVDSHCHLTHEKIREAGSAGELVSRARAAGVTGMLSICCRIHDEFDEILSAVRPHEGVWCTVGTHPHEASQPAEKTFTAEDIAARAHDPKVIGIGESGLDYYYDHSDRADQTESFRKHIRACLMADVPLVVHARDADEDIAAILREEGAGNGLQGIMHCFSSGAGLARAAVEMGLHISFSGILTFKQSAALRDIAMEVPLERLLVETDAPYLAPEPKRGTVNEPALTVHTGQMLARIRGMEDAQMADITTNNFYRLFKKAKRP